MKRQLLMRLRHGILASRGFTDTNSFHYYSFYVTSVPPKLAALFVDAHTVVKDLARTHLGTYFSSGF